MSRHVQVGDGLVDPTEPEFADLMLIAPNHVGSGTGRLLKTESARDQGAISGKYRVKAGQVVYSKIRPALAKAVIAPADGLCSADMYALEVDSSLRPRFLLYVLLSKPFTEFATDVSMRVAMPKVNREAMAGFAMPLPEAAEQERIIAYLDQETARIDELIAEQEALVDALASRRDAAVRAAVWPRPSWTRVRNKNLLVETQELSTDGSEELLSVSHLTGVRARADLDVNMFEALTTVGYKIVRPGDLVINTLWGWMGALGASGLHGIVSPAYGTYRAIHPERTDMRFFDYLYRSSPYVGLIGANSRGVWSSRLRIYPETFLAMPVDVPPRDEQSRIADQLDVITARIDALTAECRELITLLKERRAALITAAVTGKIDVRAS